MLKWKVGTQVRAVLHLGGISVKKSDRGVVTEVDTGSVMPYLVAFGDIVVWMDPAWLEEA